MFPVSEQKRKTEQQQRFELAMSVSKIAGT
jgi:hypothetical protein